MIKGTTKRGDLWQLEDLPCFILPSKSHLLKAGHYECSNLYKSFHTTTG